MTLFSIVFVKLSLWVIGRFVVNVNDCLDKPKLKQLKPKKTKLKLFKPKLNQLKPKQTKLKRNKILQFFQQNLSLSKMLLPNVALLVSALYG